MNLGIRFHDLEKLSLEERVKRAKAQKFQCVHIALSKLMEGEYKGISSLTPGYAMYLKKVFAGEGMDIAVLGCYLNLATPDENVLLETMKKYEAHIRFASVLGCGVVGTETGAPNREYRFEPACHSKEALDLFIERLRPIVSYCEKMGVLFAIEPVYKHIVCNTERARYVLDQIDSPNLRIIFDPVNLLDKSNYPDREEIIKEALEVLGDEIEVIHLKDFIVQENELKSVAAGSGIMDYSEILKFIKTKKTMIHTTLENTTPENAEMTGEKIRKMYSAL